MSAPGAPQRCIACNLKPFFSLKLSKGVWLLRCPRCGLGWWNWPPFEPATFYDRDYFQSAAVTRGYNDYAALEPGLRRTARERLRRIAHCRGRGADGEPRLLDLGCGPGIFLDEARRAGWAVSGSEISRYAADQAATRGLEVRCEALETAVLPTGDLDCVTLWDVLEHLRDPGRVLAAAAGALRPGGVLALSTGDVTSACARFSGRRWHLFTLPEHLFFFSPRSLEILLARCGLRVARVTREINWLPAMYLLERLQKSVGRRGAPPPLPGWLLPATLLDVLGVYAVRR